MGLCALANCAALFLGAVQTQQLTLPPGIPLAGYGAIGRRDLLTTFLPFKKFSRYFKSSLTEDEGGIRASVMVLKKKDDLVIVISLETVAITRQMRRQILEFLRDQEQIQIEDQNLFVTATHTHSGPGGFSDSQVWQLAVTDQFLPEVWQNSLLTISKALRVALKDLIPVQIKWGQVRSHGISKNRRDENVKAENLGHGLLMQSLSDAKIIGGIVSFPVHGTAYGISNLTLSGDLPGAIARETEKQFPGSRFLFISEEAADLSPSKSKQEGIRELSQNFGTNFKEQSMKFEVLEGELRTQLTSVSLGVPKLRLAQCASWGFLKSPFVPDLDLDKFLPTETKMAELAIGKMRFRFWPGEISSALGSKMRKAGAEKYGAATVNFTLANDYLGYFLSDEERSAGGYESCVSFYGKRGSDAFLGAVPR